MRKASFCQWLADQPTVYNGWQLGEGKPGWLPRKIAWNARLGHKGLGEVCAGNP